MQKWKPRWFVLDTEKNLLTYYDSEENPQLQGRINLEEMRGCRHISPLPGAPKSADSRSFMEVSQFDFFCSEVFRGIRFCLLQ